MRRSPPAWPRAPCIAAEAVRWPISYARTLPIIYQACSPSSARGTNVQREIFARWRMDYILALLIGIVFQYFATAPMRDLSVG